MNSTQYSNSVFENTVNSKKILKTLLDGTFSNMDIDNAKTKVTRRRDSHVDISLLQKTLGEIPKIKGRHNLQKKLHDCDFLEQLGYMPSRFLAKSENQGKSQTNKKWVWVPQEVESRSLHVVKIRKKVKNNSHIKVDSPKDPDNFGSGLKESRAKTDKSDKSFD